VRRLPVQPSCCSPRFSARLRERPSKWGGPCPNSRAYHTILHRPRDRRSHGTRRQQPSLDEPWLEADLCRLRRMDAEDQEGNVATRRCNIALRDLSSTCWAPRR
jgi:hypothetical protein